MYVSKGDFGSRTTTVQDFRENHGLRQAPTTDTGVPRNEIPDSGSDKSQRPDTKQPFYGIDPKRDAFIDTPADQAAFDTMRGRRIEPRMDPADVAENLLNRLDSNADSVVTQDELAKLLKQIGQEDKAEKLFKQIDGDEDGAITQAEVEVAVKSMLELMKSERESRQIDDGGNWARYGPSGVVNAPPSALASSALDAIA